MPRLSTSPHSPSPEGRRLLGLPQDGRVYIKRPLARLSAKRLLGLLEQSDGMSHRLGRRLGIDGMTVVRELRRRGIPSTSRGRMQAMRDDELLRLLSAHNHSMDQVARALHVDWFTARSEFMRRGLYRHRRKGERRLQGLSDEALAEMIETKGGIKQASGPLGVAPMTVTRELEVRGMRVKIVVVRKAVAAKKNLG